MPARTAPRIDARVLTMGGWVAGLACTVTILGTPHLRFGYHSPNVHLVANSVDACVALLVAYLLFGRFGRTHRLQDLLLAEGLLLLAFAGLGSALLIDLAEDATRRSFGVWLPLSLRVAAAVLVLLSALVAGRRIPRGSTGLGVAGPAAVVLATVVLLWVFREALPVAASESPPVSAQQPVITGHPLLLAAQALAAGCFLVASLAFAGQARRRSDEVLRWLGPACALGGFARVNYVLFPSLYSGWLYTGDLLRTASYLCLLVGATREISRYWAAHSQVAVLEDRRRLARELHDGVVQELGWIKSEARARSAGAAPMSPSTTSLHTSSNAVEGTSPGGSNDCDLAPIVDACDRALDEARAAVDALGRNVDEPLGYALHRAAREVADRHGGHVVVELNDAVEAKPDERHNLARITREAVGNAFRHGAAQYVRITLEAAPGGRRLVVQDDGRGFDVASTSHGPGFGLTSMRERAQGLPGAFDVESSPGQGTTVEVTW